MRQALSSLPAEKRNALLPEISPIDVLVVGKDTQAKPASAKVTTKRSDSRAKRSRRSRTIKRSRVCAGSHRFHAEHSPPVTTGSSTAVTPSPVNRCSRTIRTCVRSAVDLAHGPPERARRARCRRHSPDLPGVIIGHNDRIAWGFTNVGPDVQDLYIEKFDPANPKRYQTPKAGRTRSFARNRSKSGKESTSEHDTVTYEVTVTRHGPIIFEADGKRYALRWTALDPAKNNPESTYTLNRAHNWKEFNAALESFTAPTQNIVYADVDGHIGYHAAGVVPIRKSGDGSVPYDGSTDAGEWTSYVPVAKLPKLYDPPSGIIVTANQRIIGTDYPYFLTHSWAQPYRARRIFDLLNEKPKLSSEDFRRIQGDVYSIAGMLFAQEASNCCGRS